MEAGKKESVYDNQPRKFNARSGNAIGSSCRKAGWLSASNVAGASVEFLKGLRNYYMNSPDLKQSARRKQPDDLRQSVDRLPPHSPGGEAGVLGCCLIAPRECIGDCLSKGITPDSFYDLRNQTIFQAMVDMSEVDPNRIDLITLQQRLKDMGLLDQIGGIPYLSKLRDDVPSAANLPAYIDVVLEKYILRRMVSVCTEVVGRIYDYQGDVDTLLDEVERDILAIRPKDHNEVTPIKTLVQNAIEDISDRFERKGQIGGLSTGYPDLDYYTDGLQPGEITILTAYDADKKDSSSLGKTSLALNIVEHVAVNLNLPVAVFSLEMSENSLTKRLMCSLGRVNLRAADKGDMHESDFPKLTSAAGKLIKTNIFIDPASDLTVMQLRARARRLKQKHGIKLVLVDYLQLLSAPNGKNSQSREQEVSAISKGLKAMAKELSVPVIVISQTNEDGKIRESRSARHDTDGHWQLQPDGEANAYGAPMQLFGDKARNGEAGWLVRLLFLKCFTRYESAAKVSNEDVPGEN